MLYELNGEQIRHQLTQLEVCHQVLQQLDQKDLGLVETFALARSLHLAVECMIDIGNSLIDGFIMRDPGGYHDIVDIMEDEKVITPELASQLHPKVDLRERLIRYYHLITKEELQEHTRELGIYPDFVKQVTAFLEQEKEKGNIADF